MLTALLEGIVLFAILIIPTAILLGVGYIFYKKEEGKKQ